MTVPAPRVRPSLPVTAAWGFAALGVAMAVAVVALRGSDLAAAPVAVMGVGAAIASYWGRVRNRPEVGLPWTLFAAACVAFIVGAVLRQVLAGTPLVSVADAATLTGYGATLTAFLVLLRSRQSTGRALHEMIDGAIVLVGTGATALVVFTLPTIEHRGASVTALVQGAYPVVDALLVFVVILLWWTSANRVVSYWLLSLSIVAMLVGDIGYAVIGTKGQLVGSALLDLPFVVAFTFFGAAALHPSMRDLSAIQQRPVPGWSADRLIVIVPMLVLPPIMPLLGHRGLDHGAVWVGSVGSAAAIVLLLTRAVAAVRDHARAERGLRYQAEHDPLTALANRCQLVTVAAEMLARAKRDGGHVDVLFLDLDGFKLVNDTWGHQVGDHVLRLAAARLLEVGRPSDVVARVGGDEFVVARYAAPGSVSGEELAADIVDAFRMPLPDENALVTTVSIGLATSQPQPGRAGVVTTVSIGLASSKPQPGRAGVVTAESMLRDADTAMYRAKAAGRNRCLAFDPSMHDSVRQRVEIELALRHALERQEFLLHYQPIVSLHTGEVVGAEALLRWAHPGLGLVSPLDFVPVAEETGLIVEIGEWVVSEALRQAARWREQRSQVGLRDLWVSVNVSARQLRDPMLVRHVQHELTRHGVPADLLVLEITETAMMADTEVAAGILHRLRGLGLRLAVDDFGTGYSSLGHLRKFPVAEVKIDREFVAGIETDPDDAEIVRAVVAMSLAMRLDVVAEGVETEGQRTLLEHLGVQLGQGWLFGRPQPAEDCEFVLAQPARVKS